MGDAVNARHPLNGPLIRSGFGDCEPDDDGRDPEQAREDALRAEIAEASPAQLVELVIDGIYSYGRSAQSTDLDDGRMAALFAALRAEDAAGRLPTTVALAWDRVLASVIDNTLAHRARPAFPLPGRLPGQPKGESA